MLVERNILKQKINNSNKPVFGPFVRINSPTIVELIGYAGFDFVIIDMEHGPLDMEKVEDMVRAALVSKITPLIRVRENNMSLIQRALDAGAQGVLVPQIVNERASSAAVNSIYYYPQGNRGVCRFVRSAKYSSIQRAEYFTSINREVLSILAIEGKDAIKNLDQILKNTEMDIIFVGPYDLSQSLGVPGQTNSQVVKNAMKMVVEVANKHNIITGTFVDSVEGAKEWVDYGVKFISYCIDTGLFFDACRQSLDNLKK